MKQRSSFRRKLVWWVLFPVMVVTVTLASFARLKDRRRPDGGIQWAGAQDSLASCTYDQLDAAFGKKTTTTIVDNGLDFRSTEQEEEDDKCWSLTDRILRIPKRALLNFDSLIPLGAGGKGGVFMVFVNLDESQPPCKAAYKTALVHTSLCKQVWTHPFSARWARTKSCLAAHLNPFGTSMKGELTAGVIFQAFRQYAADHTAQDDALDTSGLMPMWAMVPFHEEDVDKDDNHDSRHFSLRRRRHHHHHHQHGDYPGVMGMIMPYNEMERVQPSVAQGRTAAEVTGWFQSAAQGLAYVHEMGLTQQDVGTTKDYKNVGLLKSADGQGFSHAIIYDWGYTAVDDNPPTEDDQDVCSLGRACDFCVESYFPLPRVGGSHGTAHSRHRTIDCNHLRTMVATLLNYVQDAATEGQYWQAQMQTQVDCSRSTQALADVLALAAQGRAP